MNKEFIPYEQALALKELGHGLGESDYYASSVFYDENKNLIINQTGVKRTFKSATGTPYGQNTIDDFEGYLITVDNSLDEIVIAPLYQQAFRWLYEKHFIYGIIIPTVTMDWTFKTMTIIEDQIEVPPYNHVDANDYTTREEAELACLKTLIELVKEKK